MKILLRRLTVALICLATLLPANEVISMGPDEFLVAGSGLIVTFASDSTDDPIAGIASIEEGRFVKGRWLAGRRLNGDENHQGRHLRLIPGQSGIQSVKLYRCH